MNTSAKAYDELKSSGELGKSQAMYLVVFMSTGAPLSHLQATHYVEQMFGKKMPARNGRIAELEERGFIRKHDVEECPVTKKSVNRWIWTGRTTPLESKDEWRECRHCEGKGGKVERVYGEPPATIPTDMFQRKDPNAELYKVPDVGL